MALSLFCLLRSFLLYGHVAEELILPNLVSANEYYLLLQMIVEEMNILTTVFMWYENEKIYYPNSALATKPISNFYRNPEMGDSVEFTVDASTSIEKIGALE